MVEQDFTTDKDAAKRAVLRIRAAGRTALFNALAETAEAMRDQPGKKPWWYLPMGTIMPACSIPKRL